jgi:hypothetical protein
MMNILQESKEKVPVTIIVYLCTVTTNKLFWGQGYCLHVAVVIDTQEKNPTTSSCLISTRVLGSHGQITCRIIIRMLLCHYRFILRK